MSWLTVWKKQVRSTRTREQQVLRRLGSYSLQYVFIAQLSLIVTIHMLHCQLKPLILIVSSTFVPDNEGITLDELDSLTPDSPGAHGDPDVLGYSQLRGAPLGISQQQIPQPSLRPERQVRSPDRHTYSEGHVRAQQRAKRVRRPRGG